MRNNVVAGRIVTVLVVAFLAFDGLMKLLRVPRVVEATGQLGFPESSIAPIGFVLLVFTALYALPRTSNLGALLLTAYLGGATAANVRVSHPLFETMFPALFATLIWAGLLLRDRRAWTLFAEEPAHVTA
jgi:hypothetical protein